MSSKFDRPQTHRPDYELAKEMADKEILRCPKCKAHKGISPRGRGGKGTRQFQCTKGDHSFTLVAVAGQVQTYAMAVGDEDAQKCFVAEEPERATRGGEQPLVVEEGDDATEPSPQTTPPQRTPTDDPGQMSDFQLRVCSYLDNLALSMEQMKWDQAVAQQQIQQLFALHSSSGHSVTVPPVDTPIANTQQPSVMFPKEVAYRKVSDRSRLEGMFTENFDPIRTMVTIYGRLKNRPIKMVRECLEKEGIPPYALGDLTFVGKRLFIITTDVEYEGSVRLVLADHKCSLMPPTFDPFGEDAISLVGTEDPVSLLVKSLVKRHKRAHQCKHGPKKTALLLCIGGEISRFVGSGSHVILNRYVKSVISRSKVHYADRKLLLPLRGTIDQLINSNE